MHESCTLLSAGGWGHHQVHHIAKRPRIHSHLAQLHHNGLGSCACVAGSLSLLGLQLCCQHSACEETDCCRNGRMQLRRQCPQSGVTQSHEVNAFSLQAGILRLRWTPFVCFMLTKQESIGSRQCEVEGALSCVPRAMMRSILGCFESWVTWSLSHSSNNLPQGWLHDGCLHLHIRTGPLS